MTCTWKLNKQLSALVNEIKKKNCIGYQRIEIYPPWEKW